MFNQAENSKLHRERRRAAGKCIYCGGAPARPGRVGCQRCQDAEIRRTREMRWRRIDAGLCAVCGKNKLTPGYVTCTPCRLKQADYQSKRREAGKCSAS